MVSALGSFQQRPCQGQMYYIYRAERTKALKPLYTPLDNFGSGWLREAPKGSLEGSSGDALQSARLDDPMDTGWLAAAWLGDRAHQKVYLVYRPEGSFGTILFVPNGHPGEAEWPDPDPDRKGVRMIRN